jgi:ATP-dependent Clp protease ATP-binding subunit ClpB
MAGTTTLSLERYQPDAKGWVASAQQLADERKHPEVQPIHLLLRGLDADAGIALVFEKAGAEPDKLRAAVERAVAALPRSNEPAYLSTAFLALLDRAQKGASRRSAAAVVQVEDVLGALTQEVSGAVADVLGDFGIGPGGLKPHLGALGSVPRSPVGEPSSSELVVDWVELARQGKTDPVIGRHEEIRRVLTILERRQKRHPVLVAEAGVGKGAILRGLAQRIAKGDVPTSLVDMHLLDLDIGALTAGTRLRSEAEVRMRKLISNISSNGVPTAIVLVRSLTRLLGTGATTPALGDVLSSALARGQLRLLATTTPEGWARIQSQEPALARELTQVVVDEPSVELAQAMVRGVSGRYEQHHQVQVSESAITASVTLAKRYLSDRFLPDSAFDLLDEAAASHRVETDGLSSEVDAQRSTLSALRAQLESLAGLDDEASVAKRAELEVRAAELEPQVQAQKDVIEGRRAATAELRKVTAELNEAHRAREAAARDKDFARLGELEHATLPALEERRKKAEEAVQAAGFEPAPKAISENQVAQVLARWTGIPVSKMLEGEADKLLKMEERLGQRVIGQPDAVQAIARAVRRSRVGLRDPKRPIGSFLFLGTSGVGKTELAKALAEFLFDDEQALTRLDMSEFMERHMAQRLLGAPPGYADSEQGGFLTEAVRRRPYSVLLFDEVEKAHQDVFNLLLQVLDDGRLTDGRGRLADFTNTVVIMTSNIGAERIMDASSTVLESDEGREALQEVLLDRLREFFRPEFLNRVGDIVVFRPLGKADLRQIVDIQLRGVQRLLARRELTIDVSDAAKDHLVELGYEPTLGARPLQRVVLRQLQDPLAEALLGGGYREGQRIHIDREGDGFSFKTQD